jgi:valyl-tRNA synthetase
MEIPLQRRIDLYLKASQKDLNLLKEGESYICNLARVNQLIMGEDISRPSDSVSSAVGGIEIFIPLGGLLDLSKEKMRLRGVLEELEGELITVKKRLSNPEFLKKAPAEVIEREKEGGRNIKIKMERFKKRLEEIEQG